MYDDQNNWLKTRVCTLVQRTLIPGWFFESQQKFQELSGGITLMKKIVACGLVAIAFVFLSGCLGSPSVHEHAQGALHSHYENSVGWSPSLGCYEGIEGYVYNAGNTSLDAVNLNLNLVNSGTGTIRDSKTVYIGRVGSGETRTYETLLDGECTQEYRVDFTFRD